MTTIPATIICGFLGAGKSTLVNRLLREPAGERLGILVNDFGAINIDKDLIKVESNGQVELTNGCVCCSIQDDLASGLLMLARGAPAFTRVVLECSGVSHPAGVLGVFDQPAVSALFHVDGLFCLIDCASFDDLDFQSGELAIDQAAYADVVLLNKADLAGAATVARVARTLHGAQPFMRQVTAAHADVPLDVLFGPRPTAAERPMPADRASADHGDLYSSFACAWDRPLAVSDFARLSVALPPGILRAKGILNVADPASGESRRGVFHLVGKRSSLTLQDDPAPPLSQLVMIGRKGAIDEQDLARALACCPGVRTVTPHRHAHDHQPI